MPRSVNEASRLMGNFIVEYSYIGRIENKRTPMIGYYRCWAACPQQAADFFMRTQRYYRNDCCQVIKVWQPSPDEAV